MRKFFSSAVLWYLRLFSKLALSLHRPEVVIGIAGSVGKSSTRNALEAILTDIGPTVSIGNSETGIPLGILGIRPNGYTAQDWLKMLLRAPFGLFFLKPYTYLIVEMGIDEPYPPKNMSYLLTIIQPDIGILVNESAVHTDQFEKILTNQQKKYFSDKERLDFLISAITHEDVKMVMASQCKTIIFNADNPYIVSAIKKINHDTKTLLTFGEEKVHDIYYTNYHLSEKGTSMAFHTNKGIIQPVFKNLLPREYQQVIAAAIIAALDIKRSPMPAFYEQIMTSLMSRYRLPKGRGSYFKGIKDTLIIDSSYNASKVATLAFLDMVEELKKTTQRPVVFLFGDMRELGKEAEYEHKAVVKRINEVCDYLYCVGPLTKEYVLPEVSNLKEKKWFSSNLEAGKYLKENLPERAIVLVKGSQNTIFLEESLKYLLSDHKDISLLCRQENYWLDIKKKQGKLATI